MSDTPNTTENDPIKPEPIRSETEGGNLVKASSCSSNGVNENEAARATTNGEQNPQPQQQERQEQPGAPEQQEQQEGEETINAVTLLPSLQALPPTPAASHCNVKKPGVERKNANEERGEGKEATKKEECDDATEKEEKEIFRCDVCNKNLNCKEQYDLHMIGKIHQKFIRKLAAAKPHPCLPCVVGFDTQEELEMHKNTLEHIMKQQTANATKKIPKKNNRRHLSQMKAEGKERILPVVRYCDICDIEFTQEPQFRAHCGGKKHKKRMKAYPNDFVDESQMDFDYRELHMEGGHGGGRFPPDDLRRSPSFEPQMRDPPSYHVDEMYRNPKYIDERDLGPYGRRPDEYDYPHQRAGRSLIPRGLPSRDFPPPYRDYPPLPRDFSRQSDDFPPPRDYRSFAPPQDYRPDYGPLPHHRDYRATSRERDQLDYRLPHRDHQPLSPRHQRRLPPPPLDYPPLSRDYPPSRDFQRDYPSPRSMERSLRSRDAPIGRQTPAALRPNAHRGNRMYQDDIPPHLRRERSPPRW